MLRTECLVLVCFLAAAATGSLAATRETEHERLVFLLQYIGVDYGAAVRRGEVTDAIEYQEMVSFASALVERYGALVQQGAPPEIRDRLVDLQKSIRDLAPWADVLALTRDLVPQLAGELGVTAYPLFKPDLARGAALFETDCAPCHGARGGGDGRAAAWQEPPPSSFRDERMNLLSPHQVYSATSLGIEGTAMPSYGEAYDPRQLWNLAFYTLTLREDFDPGFPESGASVPLSMLARLSNAELLAELRRDRPAITLSQIDRYRGHPPEPDESIQVRDSPPVISAAERAPVPDADLEIALRLESAFTRVAETAIPGLVGISVFRRVDPAPAGVPQGPSSGWRASDDADQRYPGFRRVRRGSGFFVTEDGYVLTCHHNLLDPETGVAGELIDVELHDHRRERARIIGFDPTINLAVLKIEVGFETRPLAIGDSGAVRAGQWVIAIADPPGVDRTLVTGVVSAPAQRDCYQEQRSATLLQTSLLADPHSYGGPLINIRGEVIGLSMPRDVAATQAALPALAPVYGLPINVAMTLFDPLRSRESRRSPWIGIAVLNLTRDVRAILARSPSTGIYIDNVFDPSPAASAGIRVGDVLTRIDATRMLSAFDFQKTLYFAGIGRALTLEIYRDGETFERQVTIEQRPPEAAPR